MRHSNIHTHTVFSDGKNTPEEMAEEAIRLGLVSLGFSDHSDTPFFPEDCMKKEEYQAYRKTVYELKRKNEGKIEIFCGIEKDYFSQIEPGFFDYVIGSVHYITSPDGFAPIDYSLERQMEYIRDFGHSDPLELAKRYYETVVEHAEKNTFDVQGHFDLVNKYGLFDGAGEEYRRVALEALDEVMKKVPFIEVNTGAIARGYRTEPYPDDFLLNRILEKDGKLVLNGDSHKISHLSCHYDQSLLKLKQMGFASIWQKREGRFCEVKMNL